jgi:hypothetical protein
MPRFAVLRHDSPRGTHWDFLLEMGSALRTWALPQAPEPGAELICEALPDHRLAYLDYEGPVSGQRGSVARWDRGTYEVCRQSDRELVVELCGEKLSGRVVLDRLADAPGRWRCSFAARELPA